MVFSRRDQRVGGRGGEDLVSPGASSDKHSIIGRCDSELVKKQFHVVID